MTAQPILTAGEVSRLSAVASRMQSDQDGEVTSAARMLVRLLGKHGLRIGDVVERALRPEPVQRAPGPEAAPSRPLHQAQAFRCLAAVGRVHFNDREIDFLKKMTRWRGEPSERQAPWLEALVARVKERGAW